jgi:Domain of unknown function DUF11
VLRPRKPRILLPAALVAAFLLTLAPSAIAVHDLGLFELDENALSQAAPGDDWENIAGGGGSAVVDTFITDPVETSLDDIFTGGLTKDTENIDAWFWKGGEATDKNDIEHAFAAAYEHPTTGDLIVYFGLDRMDNSGDAAAGFWFLKKPVEQKTLDSDGDGDVESVFVYEGTNTLAEHSDGDTLVQTDFTNGGDIERIEAYQWGVAPDGDPVQPGSDLRRIETGADCDVAVAGDNLCGQVNRSATNVPGNWPTLTRNGVTARFFFKGPGGVAPSSTFPTATFFEGGVNATKLLGADFCAAQLLAETRQSQSETAVLDDKAEAGFNLCAIDVTKSGPAKSKVGDDATYTIKVTNTGAVTLYKQEIVDDVIGDLSGNAGCGASLAPGASCTITVDYTVQAGDPDPLVNTVSVLYNRNDTLTGDEVTDSASHSTNLFQPSITVDKTGDALSKVGDSVKYTIKVCNTSSSDSPALIKDSVTDSLITGVNAAFGASLAPGACEEHDFNRTVQGGDPDPLLNTATAHYHPDGFPNDITASDSHSTNLFQPSITVDKTGDALSKVGDDVTYTFTITNDGSADSPNLILDSINDTVLGDLADEAPAVCDSLAPGTSCTFSVTRTVQAGDADPLVNTVTVHYHPDGFPNDITDSDSHSVNLFQPSITFDKTGDALSKVGDDIHYTLTLNNTSSADSPDLECTIADAMLGIDKDVTLASGASNVTNATYTVQPGDGDPLLNTASVTCSPKGFPNILTASDGHSVNLFQPSLKVTKEAGNPYSKAGDPVKYKVTIKNTSSADSPDLVLDTLSDSLQGNLKNSANYDSSTCGASLAFGASCTIEYTRTVQGGDPDPLKNTVSVETHPDGFPNDVDASASVEVDLLHPAYTVTKDCKAGTEPVPQEGPALFTIVITNTGDADLVITADDGIGTINLAAGSSQSFQHSIAGPFTGQKTVQNTVHTTAVLDAKYGLPNTYAKDATGDCRVGGRVNVVKTTQGGSAPVGGWTFKLYSGPDGFDSGTLLATDNTPPDTLDFGNLNLDPTKTYTVCEENVPAGWTSVWKVDTNGDGAADTIINPYNPNADDTPPQDLGNRCIDFGAGTDFAIPAGGTLVFQVDNSFPGGEPRTPGYWKNWSSCTGGGQYQNAINRGGGAAGFWTLDELLNNPGFTIGLMVLNGVWNDDPYMFQNAPLNNDCVEAVRILDKSDAKDGKKRASDAAYELATALFAAKLNFAAGAETCAAAQNAAISGQALLVGISFNGTGSYLPSNVKGALLTKRNQALALASTLDQYNNGNLC